MNPFHPGELRAQALAGVIGAGGAIRDYMPDQHRAFFAVLPLMFAGTRDADGAPRARVLSGPPGFVTSPDANTLRIAGHGIDGLAPGEAIGLLGLEFGTRRRNRANGLVTSNEGGVLTVAVQQSFGNCPQYIRVRQAPLLAQARAESSFAGLDKAARAMIGAADTFFVATSGREHGVDISHRGGPAGFVQVEGDTLTIPDYKGNRYFNTLGNLLVDERAALLFMDFDKGDVLELCGRAEIMWGGGNDERRWRFQVLEGFAFGQESHAKL